MLKHDRAIQRGLEILPGLVSWNLILFPYWGILFFPLVVAYYILLFDVYWFFQSLTMALTASISHLRIEASKRLSWKGELSTFPDWKKVHHIIIIPTYKEPAHILQRTIKSITKQDFPLSQIHIVLATEKRENIKLRLKKTRILRKGFEKFFGSFLITTHTLKPGETVGKHSNQLHAIKMVEKKIIQSKKLNPAYVVVTSCDADHLFHPKHFSYLTYKFLDDPERYYKIWQPAVLFYQNIWQLPALTRVLNSLASIWNLAQLSRKDRMVNIQNYSLAFKHLKAVGYWDPDVIPEDYHIFFKSFYKTKGKTEVEPIYLPLYADAPIGKNFWATVKNQYFQYQRWAWGVSDDPYVIKNYFLTPGMPFLAKTFRLINLLREHFLWPVNWFIITIGITLPSLFNPEFSRTVIGYTLPKISSIVLTVALGFLAIMVIIDSKYRPPKPAHIPAWRSFLLPFEYLLLPLVGFLFNVLPGLDAHTRLMLGKYLEYRVTEKA